jgi:hypothetical protein
VIYCDVSPNEPLSQGDILDECPLLFWQASGFGGQMEPVTRLVRVVVLTQACDVAQLKANRILVACVHSARELVERNPRQANGARGIGQANLVVDDFCGGAADAHAWIPASRPGFSCPTFPCPQFACPIKNLRPPLPCPSFSELRKRPSCSCPDARHGGR